MADPSEPGTSDKTANSAVVQEIAQLVAGIDQARARHMLLRRLSAIALASAAIVVACVVGLAIDEDRASTGYIVGAGLAMISLLFSLAGLLNDDKPENHAVMLVFVIAFAGLLATLVATVVTLT